MLMMLNSGNLMETSVAAYSIPNMLPAREFDLVLDVIRPASREAGRMKVCIVVQIDKDC
jgi:hypothetical protein